jgi:hypothetical protein
MYETDDGFTLMHNGRRWWIRTLREQWFAHDDIGGCVGPFGDPDEAAKWIREIRP